LHFDEPKGTIAAPLNRSYRLSLAALLVAAAALAEPKASFLHTPVSQSDPAVPLVIEGSLAGGPQIDHLVIKYRGPGDDYAELRMELQYGDLYRATLPAAQMTPPGVEYYVEGVTFDGERVALFMTAAKPTRVLVLGNGKEPTREPKPKVKPKPADPAPPKHVAEKPPPKENDEPPGDEPTVAREPKPKDKPKDKPAGKPRSELEDDLALYSAEDTVALATKHEEKVTKVPAIASSFSRDQIRALGARNVYDVLDVVPGLSVSRDVQGFYRTAVRGLRADPEVLFLLNGHRLNSFFDGKPLANLPIENIERIEVIRGPGSALYGAGAFLGVVNIVTTREEGLRATVAGGMFETIDGHVSGAKSLGELKIFGDADVLKQTGYKKAILVDVLDKQTLAQGMRGAADAPDPAGYTNDNRFFVNVGAGVSYEAAAVGTLAASVRFMDEQRAALIGMFDAVGHDSHLGWQVLQGDLNYDRQLGESAALRAHFYFDDQYSKRQFQLTPNNFSAGADPAQFFKPGIVEVQTVGVRTFGGELGSDITFAQTNRLSFGLVADLQSLYAYAYETNYDTSLRYLTPVTRPTGLVYPQELGKGAAAARLTLGLYAQDQWTIFDRLTLTFGFRADATQLPKLDAAKNITGTELVPSLNPRAGLVVAVTDALVLKLLYGRAFRSPTVQELTESIPDSSFDQGRFEGNPELKPATVDTLELGGDLVQSAGEARVRLRGNVFYESYLSSIAQVDTSGNIVPVRNRSGVVVIGAEGEARLEVSVRANAWVNASWFRAEDQDAFSKFRLLTDTPQARFNAGMSMPLGDYLNFDFVVRVGAERRNNTRAVLELLRRWKIPAYSLITAQIRTELLAEHFEVALVGQNLFAQEVYDDVPRPDRIPGLLPREGLSAFLTVRASY
jgi:outer membrane receptor protein involved in Fe transport